MSTRGARTVVHYSDSTSFGGTERALLHLLAHLDRERWRPVLFHPDVPGAAQLAREARALGVSLHACAPIENAARGLTAIAPLALAIRRERADVFHAHQSWPLSCRYGIVAARMARVPAIVASAQLFMEMPPLRAIDLQHALLTRCVSRYVAVSQHVATRLRERFGVPGGRIRVIPNAIAMTAPPARDEHLRESLTGGTDAPLVLSTARLDPQKGLQHLIAAAADVPDAIFVIAGTGPEREALEALAHSHGVAERVRFLGHRQDVADLLAACDLFVLPSLYEGLPLAVLEAMAAGVPVVATDVGGTNEVVLDGETGVLVPAADAAALAQAIRALLADRPRASALAARGQAHVRCRHSASVMTADVSRVYVELLGA